MIFCFSIQKKWVSTCVQNFLSMHSPLVLGFFLLKLYHAPFFEINVNDAPVSINSVYISFNKYTRFVNHGASTNMSLGIVLLPPALTMNHLRIATFLRWCISVSICFFIFKFWTISTNVSLFLAIIASHPLFVFLTGNCNVRLLLKFWSWTCFFKLSNWVCILVINSISSVDFVGCSHSRSLPSTIQQITSPFCSIVWI